ncbi:MAG: DHH family phosphoesterase [Chloroflexota bacterium]
MTSQLNALLEALEATPNILILPHNNPDPDAIASAVAAQYLIDKQLGRKCRIRYKGFIGRAENRALVQFLRNPLHPITDADVAWADGLVLVDNQPGAGNSASDGSLPVAAVIDHHPLLRTTSIATFVDVQPKLGATATILTHYLQAANLPLSSALATALFYGIKTDTLGLVRGAAEADIAAYLDLQPYVDINALISIETAQVPADYFAQLDTAVREAQVYQDTIIAFIGPMSYPDLTSEMADLLLRLEGVQWSVCMGTHNGTLSVSVRTRRRRGGAGKLVQAIVQKDGTAGGHGMMAGGQLPLDTWNALSLVSELTRRALLHLDIPVTTVGTPVFI